MKRLALLLFACGSPHPQPTVAIPHDELDAAMVAPTRDDDAGCRVAQMDSDGDGILDDCDRCPTFAEVWNEFEDGDGCPDVPSIRLQSSSIQIVQRVVFAPNKSEPLPESNALLDAIADVMKNHPEFELIGIIGHVEPKEPPALALARAQRVIALLVKRGVAANRFEARDGGNDPLLTVPRSVEPHVVRSNGVEQYRWNGKTYELVSPPPAPKPVVIDPKCPLGPLTPDRCR